MKAKLASVAAVIVPAVVAWVVGRGWITGDQQTLTQDALDVAAAAIALGAAIWAFVAHTKTTK